MEAKEEQHKDMFKWALLPIALVVLALTYFFSMATINGENDAQGFSGDTSKSGFVEYASYGDGEQGLLFSKSEAAELDSVVKNYAQKMQMNILIYVSRNKYSNYDTERLSDDSYDSMFGADTDGIFYYIDLAGQPPAYDYISTSGKAILPVQKKLNSIFSEMDAYLPSSQNVAVNGLWPYKENIRQGILEFLSLLEYTCSSYYTGGSRLQYYHSNRTGKYVFYAHNTLYITKSRPPLHKFVLLLVGEVLGAIAGFALYASIKKKYRFISHTDSAVYIGDGSVRFSEQTDEFLREYTTRTRINSSATGVGGGRVGGGGGTHGGGGHSR